MKNYIAYALLGLTLAASTLAHADGSFADWYSEGVYLGQSNNLVGFTALRGGWKLGQFEFYGTVRGSNDTKSSTSALGQVYNDNFMFLGLGVDYLIPDELLKGFRLRSQVGNTFNLGGYKIHKDGLDFNGGLIAYHEGDIISDLGFENYANALYFNRYENLLAFEQLRILWKSFSTQSGGWTLGAYPIINGTLSFDSENVSYNRFMDARAGVRFGARNATMNFYITPQYVTGRYITNSHESFNEFRVLAVAFLGF